MRTAERVCPARARDRPFLPLPVPDSIMTTTQFDGIYCGLSPEVGSECATLTGSLLLPLIQLGPEFRIAQSGVGWKGEESATVMSITATDIKWVQWLRVARNHQIRVALKDGTRTVFDGFSRDVRLQVLWGDL